MADEAARHVSGPTSVGHVSVRLEHMHPKDVPFSFETQAPRLSGAMGFSTLFHAIAVVAVALIATYLPDAAHDAAAGLFLCNGPGTCIAIADQGLTRDNCR